MNLSLGNNWQGLEQDITVYQSDQDPQVLERLWLAVSEYVRGYPRLAFKQRDEDIGSEFYLYIWERRDSLFKKFDFQQGSFRNYLSLRLRSHYLNFCQQQRKAWSQDRMLYSDQEELFHEPLQPGTISENRKSQEEVSFFPDYEKFPLNYLVLKLHYLDFFTEDDFVRLKEYTGKKYTELLEDFDRLREEVAKKKRRRLKLDEKLGKAYLDLLIAQEQITDDKVSQENKEKEINKIRRRILEDYHRIHEFASFKGIAQILDLNETKVANTIVYQRKLLEKKLYGVG